MTPAQQRVCRGITTDMADRFYHWPGALHKHQTWPEGYQDHITETMNIAVVLYGAFDRRRPWPFRLSDALFTLFLHDLDKLLRYERHGRGWRSSRSYGGGYLKEITAIVRRYGYHLTAKEKNALQFVHGENERYHPTKRIMLPLATFIHCCDVLSARVWFAHGQDRKHW